MHPKWTIVHSQEKPSGSHCTRLWAKRYSSTPTHHPYLQITHLPSPPQIHTRTRTQHPSFFILSLPPSPGRYILQAGKEKALPATNGWNGSGIPTHPFSRQADSACPAAKTLNMPQQSDWVLKAAPHFNIQRTNSLTFYSSLQ